jgi:hypothetical protein
MQHPETKLEYFPKQDHVCVRLQKQIQFGIEEGSRKNKNF